MEVLKIENGNKRKIFKIVVDFLKRDMVVVCPTDTVYGICGNAFNKQTVKKIFKIKARRIDKQISIFAESFKKAEDYAVIGSREKSFLKNPKITSILKAKNLKDFSKEIVSKDGKIGIRIPNYAFLKKILNKVDFPLTGTSANVSGKMASVDIKEVLKQFKKRKFQPDLVIDAGKLKKTKPSKVIDLTYKKPKILRK